MPYQTNDDLPDAVKRVLPSDKARSMWRRVFNDGMYRGYQEGRAFGAAYAAIESAGYKKGEDGVYIEKVVEKADYEGRKVRLDKPFRLPAGSTKKFGVYVKAGDKTKKVTFGDPKMEIRRDDPEARANFRSRHSCDTATDKTSARYWSCRMWESGTSVSEMTKMDNIEKRQISDDVFTTAIEAVQRAHQLGLGLVAHMTEGPDGQAFYMPGATHEDYLAFVGEAGLVMPESLDAKQPEVEDPTEDLIEVVIEAAIGAILEATMEKRASKIIKLDDEARIVWGWASVVSIDGKPMVDRQGDIISAEVMTKAADNFMADVRTAKAMHEGGKIGEVIHSFPLTKALGEALGVYSALEGWVVAMKVHDDDVWNRVKSGELAAFSIGGMGKRNAV